MILAAVHMRGILPCLSAGAGSLLIAFWFKPGLGRTLISDWITCGSFALRYDFTWNNVRRRLIIFLPSTGGAPGQLGGRPAPGPSRHESLDAPTAAAATGTHASRIA